MEPLIGQARLTLVSTAVGLSLLVLPATACAIPLEPPEKEEQEITFSSTAPTSATVGGPTYAVAATASSGLTVSFSSGTPSVCSVAGSTVSFIAVGTCTITAKQGGNVKYFPETNQQSFAVGKGSQVITFTSTAPSPAIVGGPTYAVAATASSGLPVSFSSETPSVCSVAGSTVSFIAVGTCTIDANQAGNAQYSAASQEQQFLAVSAAPTGAPALPPTSPLVPPSTSTPTPGGSFSLLGNPTINQKTGAIAFTASVGGPGTFSWLLTFPNGKFGAFQAGKRRCQAAQIKLKARCRPAQIVFGKGSRAVAAAGIVGVMVTPSGAASNALKNALKKRQGLPITAILTFQSSRGGSPISHAQSITVTLKNTSKKGK